MEILPSTALSGAKAARSEHGSPFGAEGGVRFSGLPRTEAGLQPAPTPPLPRILVERTEGTFKRLMEGLESLKK